MSGQLLASIPNSGNARLRHVERLKLTADASAFDRLAKVIEQFKAAGKEPTFDSAKWVEQHLSKVWAVIQKAKVTGAQLHGTPNDPETLTSDS